MSDPDPPMSTLEELMIDFNSLKRLMIVEKCKACTCVNLNPIFQGLRSPESELTYPQLVDLMTRKSVHDAQLILTPDMECGCEKCVHMEDYRVQFDVLKNQINELIKSEFSVETDFVDPII